MSKVAKKPEPKKSKDVKGKTVSAEKQQNTTLFEIVPGKFNENDWNTMLDIDESQEFVWELIDECIDNANKVIYANYLEKQTIPFTINEAKKAILHLIDWQFLDDDTDDDRTEVWVQDEEPESCMIDSWAQGYVQTVLLDSQDFGRNIIEETEEQKSTGSFLEELTQQQLVPSQNDSQITESIAKPEAEKLIKKKPNHNTNKKVELFLNNSQNVVSSMKYDPSCFSEERSEKKEVINPKLKQIDAEAKKLEDSIVKAPTACQSLLKTLLTRPVGMREIDIDSYGDISTMAKLDFDKIHTNIKPRFFINNTMRSDSSLELTKRSRVTPQCNEIKLTNSSTTNFEKMTPNKKLHSKSSPRRKNIKISEIATEENDLILEPVPGVVFTMLNSTRMGPKKTLVPNRQQSLYDKSEIFLKPIKPLEKDETLTRMSLEEILDSNHKISPIKQTNKFKPMPPINQNSTSVN